MSLVNLIIFLAIGALAGWVASQLMKGKSLGLLWNMIIGVVGSFLGSFLAGLLGLGGGNLIGQIAIAIGGSIVLLILIGFIKKKM
ncbi:MAG: GlsB/YeaQ/YmgE family stress response membrane protein [Leptospira sp.]|jgi:uncharacterized membrane protein YeaQ/YmgE (transglycosylase-associated protein family)|nr:GlsB/YeaQ/YmgE family stress response membrane protein [Leptospira sp.]NCS92977.1 GlsB/YeaQ/YmgE family stress response membrane protein [Leptospira sp.]